jgi:hypothetical protein
MLRRLVMQRSLLPKFDRKAFLIGSGLVAAFANMKTDKQSECCGIVGYIGN